MDAWIDVAPAADFPSGTCRSILAGNVAIAVFHVADEFFAIADICSHEAETLSLGEVDGREIVCPRHGARFSLVTGEALSPPAYEPVATYAVRVERGMVQINPGSAAGT